MKRREFIILTSIGATSAGMLSACGSPENRLIPALIPDEQYVPGLDYWKASACAMCPAGCGILVRTREHRANKIEGNPAHPVNRGALCARGQAGLQMLYNPDRIRSPMKRTAERGSGQFTEISWDEALKTLADRLREIKAKSGVAFATQDSRGVIGFAFDYFREAYSPDRPQYVLSFDESVYQRNQFPVYDIANATYLLSFGARFLETWHSPVMYSRAYGEFRRATAKARGKFVQVEPRMSTTAASADEWLAAAAQSESRLALAIAQVIIREDLIKNAPAPNFIEGPIDDYAPEKLAHQIDIPAEKIIRIAREFAASERPLVIAGLEQDRLSVNYLNTIVGNMNKRGGILLPADIRFDPFLSWRAENSANFLPSAAWLSDNQWSALLLHQVNPAHFAPKVIDKIKATPFVASFSSFIDETTELADLILPDHSYLESWDLKTSQVEQITDSARTSTTAVTLTRPVAAPEFNTRQAADVLLWLAREFGKPAPVESSEELVKRAATELRKLAGSIQADSDKEFLERFIERGVWSGKPVEVNKLPAATFQVLSQSVLEAEAQTGDGQHPLTLMLYEHAALGFGEHANLPWLQELPDPMTSVMWGSWVEINPRTASEMGIADGDLIEVETAHGAVRAPAVVYPAIRPDVIAMPFGQGHTSFGRYARGRGANIALLNPLQLKMDSTVRAKVTKVEGRARLARFGTSLPERPEVKR
jgi:anaerobic selenocysteine-containing dehydrogenase